MTDHIASLALHNRKSFDLTKALRPQLPDADAYRFIVYEVETIYDEPRRTVFDIATFSGMIRVRKSLKWLRELQTRGVCPLEVFVEY